MRAAEDINYAREIVCNHLANRNLDDEQRALLSGMSVALQWIMVEGGVTLQALVDGAAIKVAKE